MNVEMVIVVRVIQVLGLSDGDLTCRVYVSSAPKQ